MIFEFMLICTPPPRESSIPVPNGFANGKAGHVQLAQLLINYGQQFSHTLWPVLKPLAPLFLRASWTHAEVSLIRRSAHPHHGSFVPTIGFFEAHNRILGFHEFLVLLQVVAAIILAIQPIYISQHDALVSAGNTVAERLLEPIHVMYQLRAHDLQMTL